MTTLSYTIGYFLTAGGWFAVGFFLARTVTRARAARDLEMVLAWGRHQRLEVMRLEDILHHHHISPGSGGVA